VELDHHRITEISLEMSGLLEQQKLLLADTPIANSPLKTCINTPQETSVSATSATN